MFVNLTVLQMLSLVLLLAAAALAASSNSNNKKSIPRSLFLQADGYADIFLQFPTIDWSQNEGLAALQDLHADGLAAVQDSGLAWRRIRRSTVARILQDHAKSSQEAVIGTLRDGGYRYRSFWINNSLWIEGAPMHLIVLLSNLENVTSIRGNTIVGRIPPIWQLISQGTAADPLVPWNIKQIRADEVGIEELERGRGVVVGSIDTGVSWEHPLLREQYRSVRESNQSKGPLDHSHSWYDPRGLSIEPNDIQGHGTHTLGSAVGIGVGVAPGATWIAARGCTTDGCVRYDLIAAAQWMMCPAAGGDERCDLGADIVTNSWGADPGEDDDTDDDQSNNNWFEPIAEAWVAAGIIPIFAIGNAGPACRTAGSPGDLSTVIGVGAVTRDRALAPFSSRGPGRTSGAKEKTFKPDIVAPGHEILSCFHLGSGLVAMSGTSMATPHIAGVVALMVAANPALDQPSAKEALLGSADQKSLVEPIHGQLACSERQWNQFPNHQYGYGLVDAFEAVRMSKATAPKLKFTAH